MTPADLSALRALADAATPGPWRIGVTDTRTMDELVAHLEKAARAGVEPRAWMLVHPDDYVPPEEGKTPHARSPAWTGNGPTSEANATFIAAMRNALPSLLAHVAAQAERIGALEAPNPGSYEAVMAGCRCPVIDNAHGKGHMGGLLHEGRYVFVINADCPMHARRVLGGKEGT